MSNVLIAPADGRLGCALLERFVLAGYAVIAGACVPEKAAADRSAASPRSTASSPVDHPEEEGAARRLRISWNPRSFISSRNLVLTALNEFERIDSALIVQEEYGGTEPLHACSPAAIEAEIDSGIKGPALLLKELLGAPARQRPRIVSIVRYAPKERPVSSIASAMQAALSALAGSLSAVYRN